MIESTLTATKDSNLQLFFLYNNQNNEILFSNHPLNSFFDYSVVQPLHHPFGLITNENEKLASEWQRCLQLKEKESHHFYFSNTDSTAGSFRFDLEVHGINLPAVSNSPVLLVYVKKTILKKEDVSINQAVPNHQKDYAEFIDLAVHDLDAPLRKLAVLIDRMLLKIEPSAEINEHVNRVQTCLSDMRSMIESLSVLSALTANPFNRVSCDLGDIVLELLDELKPQLLGKKITVISSDLPTVHGDPVQYKQLLKTLIGNAIKFGKKETPLTIEIESAIIKEADRTYFNLPADRTYYKVVVKDNGIGFRQEYAEKIFQPFVRLHGKSEYPGNGIGLAICKKIVENHNGIIYAEGDETSGAKFILILS